MPTLPELHIRYREIRDQHRATAAALTLTERAVERSRRERPGTGMPAQNVAVHRTDLVDTDGTVRATVIGTGGYYEGFITGGTGRPFGGSFNRAETIAATRNAVGYALLHDDAEANEIFGIIETAALGGAL